MSDSTCATEGCEHAPHGNEHPHGRRPDGPGEVCRSCAEEGVHRIVPASGSCVCWINVEDLSHADLKALLADADLSITPPGSPS